jgi:hypothetical protein
VQLSDAGSRLSAAFDEPSLVSCAGLVPAVALAGRAGLRSLADRHLSISDGPGHAAGAKAVALVAGMVAGAGLHRGYGPVAPRRDGPAVRRGAGAVDARVVPAWVEHAGLGSPARGRRHVGSCPLWHARRGCCPGVSEVAYVDLDDTVKPTYGMPSKARVAATRV